MAMPRKQQISHLGTPHLHCIFSSKISIIKAINDRFGGSGASWGDNQSGLISYAHYAVGILFLTLAMNLKL